MNFVIVTWNKSKLKLLICKKRNDIKKKEEKKERTFVDLESKRNVMLVFSLVMYRFCT